MEGTMETTYLKLQDITVLEFNVSEFFIVKRNDLLPYILRDRIVDTRNIEDGKEFNKAMLNNISCIQKFFNYRKLSINRENAKRILNELNIPQSNDYETNYKAMILCNALSTADDYWITNDDNKKWKDVNVRDNPLHEALAQLALFGTSSKLLTITGSIRTPEITGLGAYAKAWFRESGKLYLYKAGTREGLEPEREALVSKILDCFNVPHVKYILTKKEGKTVTKCLAMNNELYSIVDALDMDVWCSSKGKNFIEYARSIDKELYYKTIVVDYLCSNVDRHYGNWGFFMSNKSGAIIGMHPLFDHNNAFDFNDIRGLQVTRCQLLPGKSLKDAAFYAIKQCDLRCIKSVTRDFFFNDEMYFSFMTRAEELGLYKKRQLSFLEKLRKKHIDLYSPIEIKEDNTQDYFDALNKVLEKEGTS